MCLLCILRGQTEDKSFFFKSGMLTKRIRRLGLTRLVITDKLSDVFESDNYESLSTESLCPAINVERKQNSMQTKNEMLNGHQCCLIWSIYIKACYVC